MFVVGHVPWICFKVLIKKPSEIDFYPLNIVNNFWTIDRRIVTIFTVGSHVRQTILWNNHWKKPHDLPRIKLRTVSPAFLLMRGISSQVSNLYLNNFYSYLMTLYSSLFHHNKRIKAKLHLYLETTNIFDIVHTCVHVCELMPPGRECVTARAN